MQSSSRSIKDLGKSSPFRKAERGKVEGEIRSGYMIVVQKRMRGRNRTYPNLSGERGMIAKTWDVSFETRKKGQRVITTRKKSPALPEGRIPRISRLMALAHHLECLVVSGQVRDYAELARLGQVSRARITQIMNLLLLAPDIQEEILFLPKTTKGHDPIKLRHLQAVALERDWKFQRASWFALCTRE